MNPYTIDLKALRYAPVELQPFPYVIVPNFVKLEAMDSIEHDYPAINAPGSFPMGALNYGPVFKQFVDELQSPEMTAAIGEKFGIDLMHKPTMLTVRGCTDARDGKIHTDSKTKLVTVLVYMNGKWEKQGGRLRLLRSPDDIKDMVTEVPPDQGTLLAFLNVPNAWHGHEEYIGPRRAIQLNWVKNKGVVWREQLRHRLSAVFKKTGY